jgi:hypothetical protein
MSPEASFFIQINLIFSVYEFEIVPVMMPELIEIVAKGLLLVRSQNLVAKSFKVYIFVVGIQSIQRKKGGVFKIKSLQKKKFSKIDNI